MRVCFLFKKVLYAFLLYKSGIKCLISYEEFVLLLVDSVGKRVLCQFSENPQLNFYLIIILVYQVL